MGCTYAHTVHVIHSILVSVDTGPRGALTVACVRGMLSLVAEVTSKMAAVKVEEQGGGDDDPLWNFALKVAGGDADKVRMAQMIL